MGRSMEDRIFCAESLGCYTVKLRILHEYLVTFGSNSIADKSAVSLHDPDALALGILKNIRIILSYGILAERINVPLVDVRMGNKIKIYVDKSHTRRFIDGALITVLLL
jgi:hypothetical protein